MDAPIDYFAGVKNLGKNFGSHSVSLQANFSTRQYLHFITVTEKNLDSVDRNRKSVAKNTRISIKKQATS